METLFPNIITGEKCYKTLAENNNPCAVCPIMAKDVHSCAASDTCSCDDVSELSVTPQQKLYMLTFRSEALKAKVPSEIEKASQELYIQNIAKSLSGDIKDIYEIDAIRALVDAGQVVIAAGGGGIPVLEQQTKLKGASAIIEKDYVAARLAELLDAGTLLFLTKDEKLVINADNDERKEFDEVEAKELKKYVNKNHLGEITTLPKVSAAVEFVLAGEERRAVIAGLEKAKEALAGKTGTTII